METRDVFIAYHGTYSEYGSLEKAKELFYYLESLGVKCFFFPAEKSGYFAETPIAVKNAKKFLLVCNNKISTNSDGSVINNGIKQELQTFWNCIYEGKRQRGDARVYAYDGFTAKHANELHIAFQGVAHFDETLSSSDECFRQIYEWIVNESSEPITEMQNPLNKTFETNLAGTSYEIERAFIRRSYMNKVWDISKMISVAQKIECLGISNNEITLNMDEETLKNALCNGMLLDILFLSPNGKHTKEREKEEGQVKKTICTNTETTLRFIKRLKAKLPLSLQNNLHIYVYDVTPRMNMIFIDEKYLLLQYYANAIPGACNPCFYIKKKENGQLFDFYYEQYKYIKEGGKEQ